jgi:hypothetical protein
MVTFLGTRKRPGRPLKQERVTTISFSQQDLADLGRLLAVGRAVLQEDVPVVPRLKAAMTRLGLTAPKGL